VDIDPRDMDAGSLGVAVITAFVNNDNPQMYKLMSAYVDAAPTVEKGLTSIIHGLTYTASSLLLRLAEATGRSKDDLLQEAGILFADRTLLDDLGDEPGQ
jgi:hypothetical protein